MRFPTTTRIPPPGSPDHYRLASWIVAAGAVAVGAWLRWYQLHIQVLLDDEWHAVHQVLRSDLVSTLTHFGFADYSIPLTFYYGLLALRGGLTEWEMHLPMLVAGIAFLAAAPWLLGRAARFDVKCLWVGLLALSPLLVYHSRIARPYAITCLLAFTAIVVFRRWWQRSGRPEIDATAYVLCAFLAGYLHLLTLVFTCGPFLYYGIGAIRRLRSTATRAEAIVSLKRLALLGALTLGLLAAVLAAPLANDWQALSGKAGQHSITWESAYRTALLLFGVGNPLAFLVLASLAALGFARTWRRDRDLASYWATIALVGSAVIVLQRPMWIHHPLVPARYMLPIVPWLLWMVAEGAVFVLEKAPVAARHLLMVAGLSAYFWMGPIPGYLQFPNQFMSHQRYQYDYDPERNIMLTLAPKNRPIPEFYRELSRRPPGSVTLVEAPWRLESFANPQPWYQEVHRQRVRIGLVTGVCGERSFGEYPEERKELRFQQFTHLSALIAGRESSADYLVMHLDQWLLETSAPLEWPDVRKCLPRIEARFGKPVYQDSEIVVFRLR